MNEDQIIEIYINEKLIDSLIEKAFPDKVQ